MPKTTNLFLAAAICTAGLMLLIPGCGGYNDAEEYAAHDEEPQYLPEPGRGGGIPGQAPGGPPPGDPHAGLGPGDGQTQTPRSDDRGTPPDDPNVASFLGLRAPKPAEWQWQPPQNPVIHTNYLVPGEGDDEEGLIAIYFFGPGQGGPIQMNIDRWEDQFRSPDGGAVEAEVETFEVAGMPVTLVNLEGDYMPFGASRYEPGQGFICAIMDAEVGRVFIRFTGPKQTVEANRETFMTMITELRPADDESGDSAGADQPAGSPY